MDRVDALTILSIDPSVDNMGISVLHVDFVTGQPELTHSETYHGRYLAKRHPDIIASMGERAAKLYGHMENFGRLFEVWRPDVVAVEHPFLGRFPAAFGALMECMTTIRTAMIRHNPSLELHVIDPPNVKIAVGVDGKSKDKELMRTAIRTLPGMIYPEELDLMELDEHSCDSIAVGYWLYRHIYGV